MYRGGITLSRISIIIIGGLPIQRASCADKYRKTHASCAAKLGQFLPLHTSPRILLDCHREKLIVVSIYAYVRMKRLLQVHGTMKIPEWLPVSALTIIKSNSSRYTLLILMKRSFARRCISKLKMTKWPMTKATYLSAGRICASVQ
jgi:hypothetical protein